MTPKQLSRADARRLLVRWHFAPTDVAGVFDRLGSVQYDPLRPLGCNHDLVLQARVPGYRVGDWQSHAYGRRGALDAWDKQASLVRMRDYPLRRVHHRWLGERWRTGVLDAHPAATAAVLDELRERGPLASTDFEHQVHVEAWEGSWYGPKLTKRVLRALWHTGRVATHHRRAGKHVYDLVERVVPEELLAAPAPPEEESLRFLIELRHRAVGLLRPNASWEVWSLPLPAAERHRVTADLVAEGALVPVEVDGVRFHAHPDALAALASEPARDDEVRFLAPLDQLLWDRTAVRHLFGFDYVWEVYKPERERRWGYYVLPVVRGDRFVGRLDARLAGGSGGAVLELKRWWWEDGAPADPGALPALERAFARFLHYLGADGARANRSHHAVPKGVREALKAAARRPPAERPGADVPDFDPTDPEWSVDP